MALRTHEAFGLNSAEQQLLWWDDFLGDQLDDRWGETGDVGGTADVVDAQTGGIVRILTGGTVNDDWQIQWNNIRGLHVDQMVSIEARIKVSDLSNGVYRVSIQFDDTNRIMFFYNDTNADWRILTQNTAQTSLGSGIAVTLNYVVLRIEVKSTGAHFYIDDVETANSPITTNLPDDAGDFLQPFLFVLTQENVAKSMDIDYVVVRQER